MTTPHNHTFNFWLRLALLVALLAIGQQARAQSTETVLALTDATPRPGATIGDDVTRIELVFAEAVAGNGRYLIVNSALESVAEGTLTAGSDATRLVAPMPPLTGGQYTLQWTTTTASGAGAQGAYQFAVAATPFPWALTIAAALLLIAAIAFVLVWRRVRPFRR